MFRQIFFDESAAKMSVLAVTVANSEEMFKFSVVIMQIRIQKVTILISLIGIIGYVANSGCKGVLCDHVLRDVARTKQTQIVKLAIFFQLKFRLTLVSLHFLIKIMEFFSQILIYFQLLFSIFNGLFYFFLSFILFIKRAV